MPGAGMAAAGQCRRVPWYEPPPKSEPPKSSEELLIEVNLSNIYRSESFRQHWHASISARGMIRDFGFMGVFPALSALIRPWQE
jgi:hypothetical protein